MLARVACGALFVGLLAVGTDRGSAAIGITRPNPAQPTARVHQIRQGDPCEVFGATAVNEKGEAFDCEPLANGVKRWIYP